MSWIISTEMTKCPVFLTKKLNVLDTILFIGNTLDHDVSIINFDTYKFYCHDTVQPYLLQYGTNLGKFIRLREHKRANMKMTRTFTPRIVVP